MKIYPDHNLIIYLRNNQSAELAKTVEARKIAGDVFLFSPAHLEEIAVSQMRNNTEEKVIDSDIAFLSKLCEKNSIRPVSREKVVFNTEEPRECYERVITFYKQNDLAEQMEKTFIKDVNENPAGDPKQVNNLDPAALFNTAIINWEFLLKSLIDAGLLKSADANKVFATWPPALPLERFCVLEHAINYLANWLERIGYYRESEKNSRSRMHDVSHIVYGSYADLLVSNDTKLVKKAAKIYEILSITTKAITMDTFLNNI